MDRSPVSPVPRPRDTKVHTAMKPFQFPRPQQAQPAQRTSNNAPTTHTRSHSRSGSATSTQIPKSASDPTNLSSSGGPRSRPNSHHRRNSSISTRRESAEMMGVPVPLARTDSDKDADPVLKALLALEGKHASSPRNSFAPRQATVQIPDLDAVQKPDWSEPRKPFALNSSLAGKRDSFGKLLAPASCSSEGKLGTLVEEDEEEEEEEKEKSVAPAPAPSPLVTPSKPRPHNLTLHPLSLTPTLAAKSLPSPSPTPSPRVTGLRALTLSATPAARAPSPSGLAARRAIHPAPLLPPATPAAAKPSGIPYKRTGDINTMRSPQPKPAVARIVADGMMTPEPTPTTSQAPPSPDLSPSRRAFIYQSHTALVTRVAELEAQLNTLSARPSPVPSPASRLVPLPSPTLSPAANDEFLSLIADLKAERDALRREVHDWQARVADLEKQATVLTARVETERKQAWVVKEQLGVLEIEKAGVERARAQLAASVDTLAAQVATLQRELDTARQEKEDAQAELALVMATPRVDAPLDVGARAHGRPFNGLGFQSIDSLSSATDVEDVTSRRSSLMGALSSAVRKLKAVEEEEGDHDEFDDADELAHYEDDDSDVSFYTPSRTNSSLSFTAEPRTPVLPLNVPKPRVVSPASSPVHARKASLANAWTFPSGPVAKSAPKVAEVDKFFVCLDDDDAAEDLSEPEFDEGTLTRPRLGFGFGHGFGFGTPDDDDDDMPPFVLPQQATSPQKLSMVSEDEEDEDEHAFRLPGAKPAPFVFPPKRSPAFQFPRARW